MKNRGLAEILFPITIKEFLKSYRLNKPLVVHMKKPKLEFILNHPNFEDIDILLRNRHTSITAALPDYRDEISSLTLSSSDAYKAYRNGMSLTIGGLEEQVPELDIYMKQIRIDLGLPDSPKAGYVIGYASPDGKGTAAHYDCNANFVVQIKGNKKWRLATNTSVENPSIRYTTRTPVSVELQRQSKKPMPTQMPKNYTEVLLKPGSVLFVPRGVWHETLAEGESLSLTFSLTQPTWADVFSKSIFEKLNLFPKWRALADGVVSLDPNEKQRAEKEYGKLLTGLVDDLSPLKPSEYLPKEARYSPPTGIKLQMRNGSATIFQNSKKLIEIEIDQEIKKFLDWAFNDPKIITLHEARRRRFFDTDTMTTNMIGELVRAGALKQI
jgi:50S ribosomal protein L16 3-hydroxylase